MNAQARKITAAVAAGAVVMVAAFLPWVTLTAAFIGTISKSGVDGGDGWFTAILGAFLVFTVLQRWHLVGLITAVVVVMMGIYEASDVSSELGKVNNTGLAHGSVGIGVWLTIIGGVVAGAVCVYELIEARKVNADAAPTPTPVPIAGDYTAGTF